MEFALRAGHVHEATRILSFRAPRPKLSRNSPVLEEFAIVSWFFQEWLRFHDLSNQSSDCAGISKRSKGNVCVRKEVSYRGWGWWRGNGGFSLADLVSSEKVIPSRQRPDHKNATNHWWHALYQMQKLRKNWLRTVQRRREEGSRTDARLLGELDPFLVSVTLPLEA